MQAVASNGQVRQDRCNGWVMLGEISRRKSAKTRSLVIVHTLPLRPRLLCCFDSLVIETQTHMLSPASPGFSMRAACQHIELPLFRFPTSWHQKKRHGIWSVWPQRRGVLVRPCIRRPYRGHSDPVVRRKLPGTRVQQDLFNLVELHPRGVKPAYRGSRVAKGKANTVDKRLGRAVRRKGTDVSQYQQRPLLSPTHID